MTNRPDPWAPIGTPGRGTFNARAHADTEAMWYALDDQQRRHLLVRLDSEEPTARLFATRGLTADVDQLDPAGGQPGSWIDIACTDPTINPTFAVLVDELVEEVQSAADPREAVLGVLNRWRWFWSNRPGPLSETEALGLFAELWFLHRWLTFPDSVVWWRGPLGDRHDFVHPDVSVEVKATSVRTDGPATHRITHLDQLDDPETGELCLFSLAAVPDRLATNSLTHLVDHLTSTAVGTPLENTWRERLEAARWHPAHADRYRSPLRVVGEELYRVDDRFPRITRASFAEGRPPVGVGDVSYSVDLASVASTHLLASSPQPGFLDALQR